MSRAIECPLCQRSHLSPLFPSERGVSWSDGCGCSDMGSCLYHLNHLSDAPDRPAKEVMTARAQAKFERECEEHAELKVRFQQWAEQQAELDAARKDLLVLRAQVTTLREVLKDYYHECRCNHAGITAVNKRAYTALQMTEVAS